MQALRHLLEQAHASGISIRGEGDELVVRGYRRHEAIIAELLDRKVEVMAAKWPPVPEPKEWIPAEEVFPELDLGRAPRRPCRCCGGLLYWRLRGGFDRAHGPWICRGCHPSDLREEQVEEREVGL